MEGPAAASAVASAAAEAQFEEGDEFE